MVRAALALLAAAAAAVAPHTSLAAPAIKDSNIGDVPAFLNNFSSTAEPVPTLPYPIAVYSQAAGLAQQTYCRDSAPGVVVGDSKLLWTYGDGTSQQRVNIYNSSSLGLSLAYQGTNTSSVHSLVYDVDFIPVPGDKVLGLPFGSLVDQGFQNAFLSSWDVVQKQLIAYGVNNSTRKVTVIGHSLGASQASLAAFAVEKAFGSGSVTRVVTFGQPRVGDIVYANYVDKVFAPTEATRRFSYVVSGKDFVVHLPSLCQLRRGLRWTSR